MAEQAVLDEGRITNLLTNADASAVIWDDAIAENAEQSVLDDGRITDLKTKVDASAVIWDASHT